MLSNHLTSILRSCKYILVVMVLSSCASVSFEDSIKDDIEGQKEEFTACYKEEMKKNDRSELKGNIIFDFKVDRVGVVKDSKLQNSYWMSDKFKSCMLGVLNQIVFTPSVTGKTVRTVQAIKYYPSAY